MIYVKRHNFAFIKVPKNASISISRFLVENVVSPEDYVSRTIFDNFVYAQGPDTDQSHFDLQHYHDLGYIPEDTKVYAIIRNPLERMLSLYLYRVRQGRYGDGSVEDFQRRLMSGHGILQDHPWQMQPQHTFTLVNGVDRGTWFTFDDLFQLVMDIINRYDVPIMRPLRVANAGNRKTRELVSTYYSDKLIELMRIRHSKDFELYERCASKTD